jgi:diaminohydroxyphosphoribosylaminopyrimidine deaminase / 5-amino-6-(5-phosphoribosylamino)uracil reductase
MLHPFMYGEYTDAMKEREDKHWMTYALRMALRGQGRTAENPAVGCVLVANSRCVGQGWTADGGRPHAETQALLSAGTQAQGATAYVTLEPCSHYGHTPPCVNALIAAGIDRVVIACGDTDMRVAGQGIMRLQKAGIVVKVGVMQAEALALNAGFFRRIHEGLPWVSVKIATSSNEKITDPLHRWITSDASRNYGHMLRSQHQAIVTGVGTVLADDPLLTCRLHGRASASPVRVILDHTLKTPLQAEMVRTAHEYPTFIITSMDSSHPQVTAFKKAGVTVYSLPDNFSFTDAMRLLASKGVHRVLIEGGQGITTAALRSGIANMLYWFKAGHEVKEAGMDALLHGASLDGYMQIAKEIEMQSLNEDKLFMITL